MFITIFQNSKSCLWTNIYIYIFLHVNLSYLTKNQTPPPKKNWKVSLIIIANYCAVTTTVVTYILLACSPTLLLMRSLKPVKLFLPLLQPKNPAGLQLHTQHYRQTAVDSWSRMCRYTLIKSFALNWHRLISLCVYSVWLCLSLACMRVCMCVSVYVCVCVCVCAYVRVVGVWMSLWWWMQAKSISNMASWERGSERDLNRTDLLHTDFLDFCICEERHWHIHLQAMYHNFTFTFKCLTLNRTPTQFHLCH